MTEADRPSATPVSRTVPVAVPIAPTRLGYWLAKRSLDIGLSTIGLVISSPVMLAIATAVRLESHGPILFRQERVGLGGRIFTLYKFRTMHAAADQEAHRRYVQRLIRRQRGTEDENDESTWIPIEGDPRITKIGGFLRRSHLDELPQLINVLRGDMSVVGPRPPIPYEVELYEPWHLRRLSVVPGLTGLWQVRGWGRLSFDAGVALDIEYVETRSFTGDLAIILRTVWQILTGRQF
jgi:lipopolysaccharide/colanic/teichoic acid biosynthesis glycosyltransferase